MALRRREEEEELEKTKACEPNEFLLVGLVRRMIIKNVMLSKLWKPRISGFDSYATAEEVTEGIEASHLTAIVTGATSGLGLETTRVLALRGVHVVIAVKNVEAGENVKSLILDETRCAKVQVMQLDVSSLKSVRDFCNNFVSLGLPLNILINNAAIMGGPFKLSLDGMEMNFATNYLGHFLITKLLLPIMITTAKHSGIEGRIINVSSELHRFGAMELKSLNDKTRYWPLLSYARSKLANILHAEALAKRLWEKNTNVTINSLHPGIIKTNIFNSSPSLKVIATCLEALAPKLFLKTIPQGAATQCFLALHPSVAGVSGMYFQNCAISTSSKFSKSSQPEQKLWDFTENLLNEIDSNSY